MTKSKLKVGVVGLGMGHGHIAAYQQDERVEVVAIADIDEKRLKEVADDKGIAQTYTCAETMFKEAGLDAVSIATPNCLHRPFVISALEAGLHVLCEKPLAMSVKEAQDMKAAGIKAGKNLMINFSYRYHPTSQSLKKLVDKGVMGEIYSGRTMWHRRRGIPGFGGGFGDKGGWFSNKEMSGGGPLIDLGIHRLDLAMWLMGYPDPISVSGSTYDLIARQEADKQGKHCSVEDLAMGFVRFDNGASLVVESSWAVNQQEQELMETRLYGTKAGLCQRNINAGYEFEAELYLENQGSYYTQKLDVAEELNSTTYKEFIDSIIEKREPTATADQGIRVQKVLEGLYRSAAEGKEVRFDG